MALSLIRSATRSCAAVGSAFRGGVVDTRRHAHLDVPENPYMHENRSKEAAESRRGFTYLMGAGTGIVAAASAKNLLNEFLDTMSTSADVKAMAQLEVELGNITEGQNLVLKWQGKPTFVRRRTAAEIASAEDCDMSSLVDKETDDARVKKKEWLVLLGVCTHLGCVPISHAGQWGGYFCPCHGSHYDTSGRIRKGPAPENLYVPKYKFQTDDLLVIG